MPLDGDTPDESGGRCYQGLLAGDADAQSAFAVWYLDRLVGWLQIRHPKVSPEMCITAAEDAIIAVIANPRSYKPLRQSLDAYLRMSAGCDLKNLLHSEWRHSERSADWDASLLSYDFRRMFWDVNSDPALVFDGEFNHPAFEALNEVRARVWGGLTIEEVAVLELILDGERKTGAYAAALGIAQSPPDEQHREVKRVKDKLSRRLHRACGADFLLSFHIATDAERTREDDSPAA
ncbi:MAG: hypothetical protein WKH64_10740 [Chloroflexia bacterium]